MNQHPDDYPTPTREEVLERRLEIYRRLQVIAWRLSDPDSRCDCTPVEIRIRLTDDGVADVLIGHDDRCRIVVDETIGGMERALFGGG